MLYPDTTPHSPTNNPNNKTIINKLLTLHEVQVNQERYINLGGISYI